MTEEQIKLANSYIKLDEVTELIGDLLCIPDFESRNITEKDVSKVYGKILGLDRKVLADKKGDWIPVSERLPEESGRYLTYIVNEYDEKLQYIMTADYISRPTPIEGLSPWNIDDECASDNVVAWQPLPEPYKAESEVKDGRD